MQKQNAVKPCCEGLNGVFGRILVDEVMQAEAEPGRCLTRDSNGGNFVFLVVNQAEYVILVSQESVPFDFGCTAKPKCAKKIKELILTMRKILLVIDMQNDFIDGPLGTLEAEAIIDQAVQVIYKYPLEDIIATRDTHDKNYLDTQEGKKLPIPHCVKGTLGWNLHPRITAALNGATIMGKSTFASKKLAEKVASLAKTDELEVTIIGLCTDICVISNALLLKAYLPETPIRVIASACAGVTPESHQAALKIMESCQIEVLP